MYKSTLTKQYEEILRKRHKTVLDIISEDKGKKVTNFHGLTICSAPTVFPPWKDSLVLAEAIRKIKSPGNVLDLGCGTGIQGLVAAKRAKKVLFSGINTEALKCTRENALQNKINNFEIRESDLFSKIPEKFDTIIFNPPFRPFKPENKLDAAMTDENYKTLTAFFEQVKMHLNSEGKIYICFSDLGDLGYFKSLIEKKHFKKKILAKEQAESFGESIKFYYYIYELRK